MVIKSKKSCWCGKSAEPTKSAVTPISHSVVYMFIKQVHVDSPVLLYNYFSNVLYTLGPAEILILVHRYKICCAIFPPKKWTPTPQ